MNLLAALLLLVLAADSTTAASPRVRRGSTGPVRGRGVAFPTGARAGQESMASWIRGHTSPLGSAGLDTLWSGRDLNGDGQPDLVLRCEARERPLTGQWIEIHGGWRGPGSAPAGGGRAWLLRTAALVPKSLLELKGEGRPLVLALEPHAEGWSEQRGDPPARSRLLALQDSTVRDVSREHPEWFAPAEQAAAMQVADFERRGQRGHSWAEMVLQRTWCLLSMGRAAEARVFCEGRVDRAAGLTSTLGAYLDAQRRLLEQEWAGK